MNLYIIEIILLVLLILLLAYLSAITAAYAAFDMKYIDEDNKKKKNKNKRIKKLLKKQSKFIRALGMSQVLTELCIAGVAVEVFATPLYRIYVESKNTEILLLKYIYIFLTTLIITYILLIFSKIIPKHIGFKNSKEITYSTINIIYVLSILFTPFAIFLHKTDDFFLERFEKSNKQKDKYSDIEFKSQLELETDTGVITEEHKQILANIVRIDKLSVKRIMNSIDDLKAINIDFSREDVIKYSIENNYSWYPVYDRDINNVLGIVSIKEIFKNQDNESFRVEKLITPTLFISERKTVASAFREMKKNKIHIAIVQDDANKIIGFFTVQDIYGYLSK